MCLLCESLLRVVTTAREARSITMFTLDRKSCFSCKAVYFPSYYEYTDKPGTEVRKYLPGRFLSATQDSMFEVSFLESDSLESVF